ncbi:hypothetical protein [Streptococcus suis]|uniref:hypothetical protein n=1 Tax=Streptococcus suis TaxID=1307 RepID=UPI00158147F5|nr:hypothetical protein [Streptococcus suis]
MQSKSQQFVFYTPNLTITTAANKVRLISNLKLSPRQFCSELYSLYLQPPTVTTLTVGAIRGGLKQSGNRLFQLNNLKREMGDALFY